MNQVVVGGVGMVPFKKPRDGETFDKMGERAIRAALADAGVDISVIQQAYAGWIYGDSTSGQTVLYGVGQTGIPVINVNNNCSTGSTALYLARQAVQSGAVECALAFGFEQMPNGALSLSYTDRPSVMGRFEDAIKTKYDLRDDVPFAPQYFGLAGQEHMDQFGTSRETFAKIAVKARTHAGLNPLAIFRDPITVEEVLNSPTIVGPLTRLMCCPPSCGAAAAVLCTPEFARKHGIASGVIIRSQAMTTDTPSSFQGDMRNMVGFEMTASAARQVYEDAGVDPYDIPVVELHDCFATNELICYEALGLTPEGTGEKFVDDGDNTFGGRVVTNPSGGLLSKGHPLGATGLAQCAELVWQLRGAAGDKQVDGATLALQHNLGLGGAGVVTLYQKVDA
ncbi:lipid-transfer protein [Gordonia sp. TBRC 11910]|uniref:propanoyl-CoA C-acyltransferase n=1 Tax=Gordonia asplenii TaxID=2725283 RepID=A0A848KYE6_9ACTN|nr:lipid-transfer protein [Gordonia asplenii]NMO03616.1 lipid-transfer protein [Gordonia asplenii]